MAVVARYFDGRSARAHAVRVEARPGYIVLIDGEGGALARWATSDLTSKGDPAIEPVIRLASRADPDARLVFSQPEAIQFARRLLPALRRAPRRGARLWLPLGAGALAVIALAALAIDRLPGLAAPLVPQTLQEAFGDSILDGFAGKDGVCDNPAGVAALDDLTRRLSAAAGLAEPARVRVIRVPQVNAFAAPGARIAILSGLIDKAEGPDEAAGVLAHELGHAVNHDAMRALLRDIGTSTALTFVFGGGSGLGDIAGYGQVLMSLSYSRAAEAAADAAAIGMLERAGLRSDGLNRMLVRLREEGDASDIVPAWLLTHPATETRIAATARPETGESALAPEQWEALRAICGREAEEPERRSEPGRRVQ
jgi:Zn-dependent protease with chaperone function